MQMIEASARRGSIYYGQSGSEKRKSLPMENGDSSESAFLGKANADSFRLPEGCWMPVGYMGWFIGGADLILLVYAHSVSMSTDMLMSPAPPSNRWWGRLGGECTCHSIRWPTPESRGRRGPGGSRVDYPLSYP